MRKGLRNWLRWGWIRGLSFGLVMLLAPAAPSFGQARSCNVFGDWVGALDTGAGSLHLVLHVKADAAGKLAVTLDSPDQGVAALVGADAEVKGGTFSFTVPSARGSYKGTISAGCNSISGSWSQGQPLPLVFERQRTDVKPSPVDGYWLGGIRFISAAAGARGGGSL